MRLIEILDNLLMLISKILKGRKLKFQLVAGHSKQIRFGVSCSADQMLEIVRKVELYPEFVPFCSQCRIIKQTNELQFSAELSVAYGLWSESYLSEVTIHETDQHYSVISLSNNNPTFTKLVSHWLILKKQPTSVEYSIDFQFKSWLL